MTGTVPSNALIVSSILSKKAIEDLDALVLDVKFGRAAFMKTAEEAEVLADRLHKVSELLGMRTCCYISEMNNPIGFCIGNAIEIQESLDLLKYKSGHSKDLEELVCEQGGRLLVLTSRVASIEEGREQIRQTFRNGSALAKFRAMLIGQGVDATVAEQLTGNDDNHVDAILKLGPIGHRAISSATGFVESIDALKLGTIVQRLGGGRLKSTDRLDFTVGIRLLKHVGDPVNANEAWAILYASEEALHRYPKYLDEFNSSLTVSASAVPAARTRAEGFALNKNSMKTDIAQKLSDGKDFEGNLIDEQLSVRVGVRDVKCLKTNFRIVRVKKLFPALVRKNAVTDEGRDVRRAVLEQSLSAFDQRSSGLNQIVDDHAVKTSRIAFFHRGDAFLVALPDFAADHHRIVRLFEQMRKAFVCAVVRKGDREFLVVRLRSLHFVEQQTDGRFQTNDDARREVKLILQGVNIENDDLRWTTAG